MGSSARPADVQWEGVFNWKVTSTSIRHVYEISEEGVRTQPLVEHFVDELQAQGATLLGCDETGDGARLIAAAEGDDLEISVWSYESGITQAVAINSDVFSDDVMAETGHCDFS